MIYLARHGQTAFNAEGRLQGHVDSPLTELGVRQARQVGARLAELLETPASWRILSSPLGRARTTAEAIRAALGAPAVELDERLIEVSWGDWDGRLRAELAAEHPEAFGATGWTFRAPAGEPYEAVAARLAAFVASLPPEPDRRMIVVSHGVAGRVLRGVYAALERETALGLEVPQDAVFRLAGGQIERIDCAPATAAQ